MELICKTCSNAFDVCESWAARGRKYCSRTCMIESGTGDTGFWRKVKKSGESDCWIWQGQRMANGYGQIGGEYAHRRSARMAGMEIKGKFVCHTCDVRLCVNPAHLFVGLPVDNVRDMLAKGRGVHPSRLTPDQVREIRAAHGVQREIAARFAITQSHVSLIKSAHHRRYVK